MCKISQGVKTFKIFLSVFGGMYAYRVQNLRRHFKKWNACTCGHFVFQNLPHHFSLIPSRYPVGT